MNTWWLGLTLLACNAGEIRWPGGRSVLRTALVQPTVDNGIPRLTLVLSNSDFACELPREPDPLDQAQAVLELQTAACREGAEHVLLDLWRADGNDWEGLYPGDDDARASGVSGEQPRLARGTWYGIDEAAVVQALEFGRTYGVIDAHREVLGGAGEVEITDADGLSGRFEFPSLAGRFQAELCAPDANLFTILRSSPIAACPTTAGSTSAAP